LLSARPRKSRPRRLGRLLRVENRPDRHTIGAIVGALGGMLAIVVLVLARPLVAAAVYLIFALLGWVTH
jgi:hypothetical protein